MIKSLIVFLMLSISMAHADKVTTEISVRGHWLEAIDLSTDTLPTLSQYVEKIIKTNNSINIHIVF